MQQGSGQMSLLPHDPAAGRRWCDMGKHDNIGDTLLERRHVLARLARLVRLARLAMPRSPRVEVAEGEHRSWLS